MYTAEGGASFKNNLQTPAPAAAAAAAQQAANSIRTGGKVVRNGGRALINSMRNLTVGTGATKSERQLGNSERSVPPAPSSGLFRAENAWETNWDDDEDEDESDESTEHDHSTSPQKPPASPTRPPDLSREPLPTISQFSPGLNHQEWDNGILANHKPPVHEKPSVQMFLPLLRVLGKGSFGKVVLCQKRSGHEQGALFAMKILRKTHLVKRRQIERTRTERKVLSVVDHPFIMKLHYAFQTEDKLYLVLDYCPGGELFFHLSRFRRFPERVARFYAAELLLALGHLHKRGIIYRDLKPENVLLDAEGHVKLGDFGLAKAGIRHPCEGATSMCGTPEYMAPEVLAQQGHGFSVDYWGLGMLTYEMMTGLPPWYTTDRAKLFRRLKSAPLEIPSFFSHGAAQCVSQLLQRDPRRRLGVSGIRPAMEIEFFRTINWRALFARKIPAPIHPCEGWKPPEGDERTANMGDDLLDAATANFDNTFTRMKVDSEGGTQENHDDGEDGGEELHEHTFVGFTFDVGTADAVSSPVRERTYHVDPS